MTLLRKTAAEFAELAGEQALEGRTSLAEMMIRQTLMSGHGVGPAEQRSWDASLPVLAADLRQAGLLNVDVLLEYQFPLSSHRADVVLCGRHPRTGGPSYVIVELKQWSSATAFEDSSSLFTVPHAAGGPKLHPVLQVRNYSRYLTDFAKTLEGEGDAVAGAAYLHNAVVPSDVDDLRGERSDTMGSLFTGSDRAAFQHFLQARLAADTAGAPYADRLLNSAAAPSKQLLTLAAAEIKDREQFVLLGEQQLAVTEVLHAVDRARKEDTKRIVLITGGPGSGKSVIALSLLGDLARKGRSVLHATGSKSFTSTLRKIAGARDRRVQEMFKYFNSFMDADKHDLDVLILDEAHRLRLTSANRFTRAEHRTGRAQIDELIDAAHVPVFLLDQHQVVRPGEMGSVQQIHERAAERKIDVVQIDLASQFRCGGSEEYVRWVHRLLGLAGTELDDSTLPVDGEDGTQPWTPEPGFEVVVAASPLEMEAFLDRQREQGDGARMSAGYCWPWSDPTPDRELVPDVRVGEWARPWNSKSERRLGDVPPSHLWASEDGGFGQVGCVYTAQGFEYDWSGVIIGPDLVWRDGAIRVDRAANRDPSLRSKKTVTDDEVDRLVRHVYKVLLTRGMKGTVLYAVDPETQAALQRLVPQRVSGTTT